MAQDQTITDSELSHRHPLLTPLSGTSDRQREERPIIAVEHQPGIGLLLEEPPAQQKEQKPGQRVEIAVAPP